MKPLAAILFLSVVASAQEGTVRYEVTTRAEVELPPEMAHLADQFPGVTTAEQILLFDGPTALAKPAPRHEADAPRSGMVIRRSETVTYVDADVRLQQTEFLGRTFLIRDTAPRFAWRLTDEQSEFLGYPCQKAVAVRDSTTFEAWFTPQIPASVGPDGHGGLPGLILVLTQGDGRRTFVAQEVSLDPLPDGAIEPPDRGRAVTREAYDQIVEEKLEELGGESGSGSVRVIRVN